MQSSDERATAQIIAERTLALTGQEPPPDVPAWRRPLIIVAVLLLCTGGGVGLWLWRGPPSPGTVSLGEAAEAAVGAGGAAQQGSDDTGLLNCSSWPSATVYVDGRRLPESTPITGLRLQRGSHTLTLVSKDGTQRKEMQVNITPSTTRTVVVSLDR